LKAGCDVLFLPCAEFWKPRQSGGLSVAVVGPTRTAAADMDLDLQAVVTVCNSTAAANSTSQNLGVRRTTWNAFQNFKMYPMSLNLIIFQST
jgi:hypothetical protein